MLKVKLDLPFDIQQRLDSMHKDARKGLIKGMRKGMFLAEKAAKDSFNTPRHLKVRSGYLRRMIESDVGDTSGKTLVGSLGSNVIYAAIHEMGGVIRARAGNYLKFIGKDGWVTVKSVIIPERKYLRPAITENLDEITNIIRQEIIKEVMK